MKDATKEKVEKEIAGWDYMANLPPELFGFSYRKEMKAGESTYDLYRYANDAAHRSVTAYYHEETHEYKLRVRIGLTEFCRIECIAPTLEKFEALLRAEFEGIVENLAVFRETSISSIVRDKHVMEWEYGKNLPRTLEGFSLFIRPSEPLGITNGSYVVLDYTDFSIESNFIIYYNIYRDEFFGEAHIRGIPQMNYVFDSTDLPELEEKLDAHLAHRLREVRAAAGQ